MAVMFPKSPCLFFGTETKQPARKMQVNWKAVLVTAFGCAGAVNLKLSFNEKLEGQVERVVTTSVWQDFSDVYAHEKGDDLKGEASGHVKPNEKLSARAALSALLGTRALYCDPGYGYCDSTFVP